MFKKSFSFILVLFLIFWFSWFSNVNAITIVSKEEYQKLNKTITISDMFNYFAKQYNWKIPESYKYINVEFSWIPKDNEFYKSLQKLIYIDVIKNTNVKIKPYKKVNAYVFYHFAEKIYKVKILSDSEITSFKQRYAVFSDISKLEKRFSDKINNFDIKINEDAELKIKKQIFSDVYKTITQKHYNKRDINKNKLVDSAIKWLAKWSWDKYTVYFPPVANKNFKEVLNWEYEWIWAYVEMETPWVFKIVSPISWSPAEKSWLKWWDIVTHVDWREVTEKYSLNEIVSWIKWPKWTEVNLTIKRGHKILEIKVIRDKIILKEVESKKINSYTLYVKMKIFGNNISSEFKNNLEILKTDKNIKKIIFDLRWNWWWYLDQVSDILWNFVPLWEPTAVVKSLNWDNIYRSNWNKIVDFNKYKLVVLQNGGTASASEIFIWTLKDYYPKATIIWEQSYWKGSVQTIKGYRDWSSFKYTIAHWFTWKTETWINWVWITPDIKIEMDKYWVEQKEDKQLQRALKLR